MNPKINNKTNSTDDQHTAAQPTSHPGRSGDLSYLYGSIGIQAVAAAARYCDVRKKSAHAQGGSRIDQRFVESAV